MNYAHKILSSQVDATVSLGKMILLGAALVSFWGCSDSSGTLGPVVSSGTQNSAVSSTPGVSVITPVSSAIVIGVSSSSTTIPVLSSAVIASSASVTGSFTKDVIWTPTVYGSVGAGQVLDPAGVDGGWWYSYSDADNDNGSGAVSIGNGSGEWSASIEENGMIDVTMTNGIGADYPFTGIGFNWTSDENGGEGPYAITDKTGLCVRYKSDAALSIELKWNGATNGYATFQAALPKTDVETTKLLLFSIFKRGYTDADHPNLSITDALTQTTGIQIKFAGAAGTVAHLQLSGIGFSGACSAN